MYGEPQSDCGLSAVTSESAMKRGAALVEKARAQKVSYVLASPSHPPYISLAVS